MKVTVLGSGTSSGIPVVGCPCPVCTSANPKNRRLRSSCLIEVNGKIILIDTTPDLRQQCLIFGIKRIDAVLFTHTHADHVHGIDDIRPFNVWQGTPIPAYGHPSVMRDLVRKFPYVFESSNYPSITPELRPASVEGRFDCVGVPVQMVPCRHGPGMTYNYRIGNAAWLTDTNGIPDSSLDLLKNLEVLFLDGLRLKSHPTHFHLEQSLEVAKSVGAKKTYLIHLAHDYDHDAFNAKLPPGIELAYDGLTLSLTQI